MEKLLILYINNFTSYLQKYWKKGAACVALIPVALVVLLDLGSSKSYLKMVFGFISFPIVSAYSDAIEIIQTPLVALTIEKIITLIFYILVAKIIFFGAWGMWSLFREKLEEYN